MSIEITTITYTDKYNDSSTPEFKALNEKIRDEIDAAMLKVREVEGIYFEKSSKLFWVGNGTEGASIIANFTFTTTEIVLFFILFLYKL